MKYNILYLEDSLEVAECLIELINVEDQYIIEHYASIEMFINSDSFKDISKFDMIITDLNMDKIRGNKFIEFIRENNLKTPVIINSSESFKITKKLEPAVVLQKPFSHRELNNKINKVLQLTSPKLN